ncbi:hypothetical protein C8J57DRAFT_1231385 [Mycena rebaudengoi]|nr:hypothetical protein C8J57DRAFT_1231385 [Mycena rebaudengoi]
MPQNSPGSITEWHRALTKGESALPKRVTSWPQSNISSEDAGRWWSFGEKHRASTKAECALLNIVGSPAWLKNLCGDSLGSKVLAELRLQLDSKITAEDAGVGTILELDPDIFGYSGGASTRTTELRPRLTVLR